MPEYDYRCEFCESIFTEMHKVNEFPESIKCYFCGGKAPKIISFQGALHTDHPTWLDDSVRGALQGEEEKPIETRGEYNKYLADNGIVPKG